MESSKEILGTTRAGASGRLIVNADDWGRDPDTTNRTLECHAAGALSSVSAMVLMEDSERAADVAKEKHIDAGLHLNFTTPFSAKCSPRLIEHQRRLAGYLGSHRLAQTVFHPGLANSFRYTAEAQLDEYQRLYGTIPRHLDGHHHMHLCANVLYQRLLPPGTAVRRNFSFHAGDKGFLNRTYRRFVDGILSRQHALADYLFSLPPLEATDRLQRVFSLARDSVVEVECHPVNPAEHRFLTSGEIFQVAGDRPIACTYDVF